MIVKNACKTIFFVELVLVAVLFALMTWFTPPIIDDRIFAELHKQFGFAGAVVDCYQNDNIRLSNICMLFVLGLPGYMVLRSILAGLAVAAMLGLLSFAAVDKPYRYRSIPLIWLAALLVVPWRDNMFLLDFSLNYIFSASIALCLARIWLRNGNTALCIALAALMAFWHEGWALASGAGMAAVMLSANYRTKKRIAALVVMAIVATAVFFCPGMLARTAREAGEAYTIHACLLVLKACFLFFLLLPALISVFLFGRDKFVALWKDRMFVYGFGASFAGVIVCLLVRPTLHAGFISQLFGFVAWIRLVCVLLPRRDTRLLNRAHVLALALCIAQNSVALHWLRIFDREYKETMDEFLKSDNGIVFKDLVQPEAVPAATLNFPKIYMWHDCLFYSLWELYSDKPYVGVIPTVLRNPGESRDLGNGFRAVGNTLFYEGKFEQEVTETSLDGNLKSFFLNVECENGVVLRNMHTVAIRYILPDGSVNNYVKILKSPREKIVRVWR